jgi:hypothetical protein
MPSSGPSELVAVTVRPAKLEKDPTKSGPEGVTASTT